MTRISVKTLKRTLKKAGLKTTGRKSTLTKRAKKAHLLKGGGPPKLPQRSMTTGIPTDEQLRLPQRSMTTGIPDDRPQPPPPNLRSNAELPPPEPVKEKKDGGRHRRGHRSRKGGHIPYGNNPNAPCPPGFRRDRISGACVDDK